MPPHSDPAAICTPGLVRCPVCEGRRWRFADGRVRACRACDKAAREHKGVTRPCPVCGRQRLMVRGELEPCWHCVKTAALRDAATAREAEAARRRRERA